MRHFEDRVAVVTGGGGGLGEALALALAQEGMHVAVADVDAEGAERVAAAVRGQGRRALGVPTDVSRRESVRALAECTRRELGGCHLLCNNAGVLVMGSLQTRSDQDWEWVLGVNLWGVVNGVQAFLPQMLEAGGERHIVNVASISGLVPLPNLGIYTTSKYAVVGLSESLRADLEPEGIGVSVVCPGGVHTRILQSERNRPPGLGTSSVRPGDFESMPRAGVVDDDRLAPADAARRVVEGVRENALYIATHARYRSLVERRSGELLAAFDRAASRGRA